MSKKESRKQVVDNIDSEISNLEKSIEKDNRADLKNPEFYGNLLSVLCVLFSFSFIFTGESILDYFDMKNSPLKGNTIIIGAALTFYFTVIFSWIYIRSKRLKVRKNNKLTELIVQKSLIDVDRDSKDGNFFTDIIEINNTNISQYYSLAKDQSEKSFNAAMTAGLAGFCLIVTGIFVGFLDNNGAEKVSNLSSIAGVLIEFISGVFFYLHTKSTLQLKEYHNNLLLVQDKLMTYQLIDNIKDKTDQFELLKAFLIRLNSHSTTKEAIQP